MDYCPNGCPCDGFDCNSTLNSTDPVFGRKSLGILETGTHYTVSHYSLYHIDNINYKESYHMTHMPFVNNLAFTNV